jgi:hypothetical protein
MTTADHTEFNLCKKLFWQFGNIIYLQQKLISKSNKSYRFTFH